MGRLVVNASYPGVLTNLMESSIVIIDCDRLMLSGVRDKGSSFFVWISMKVVFVMT